MNRGERQPGWGHAFESPGRGSALGSGEKERACGKGPAKSREHASGRGPASGRGLVTDEGQDFKMWNRSAADHGFSGFALPKKGSQEGHGKDGGPPVKAGAYPWRRRKIRPGRRDDAVFKLRKPMAEMGRYKKRRGGNVSPLPVYSSSPLRTTRTSHLAWRTMASETLPMIKRSTAFNPVAPQTIKSASNFLAISLAIFTLGEP